MFIFENASCPCCGKPLKEGDDLAVCPVCGTPHHRECYRELGHCFNEARHAEGFEWVNETLAEPVEKKILCPRCARENAADALFCNYCGSSMKPADTPSRGPASLFAQAPAQSFEAGEQFDGIPIKDWSTYLGRNAGYYLSFFKMQDKLGRRFAFTWSALFFPFLYFIYRRAWLVAILAAVIDLILQVPAVIVTYLLPLGVNYLFSEAVWNSIYPVTSALMWTVRLCWGLFAVWIIRRSGARRIEGLRRDFPDESQYSAKLHTLSGPAIGQVIGIGVAYFGLIFVLSILVYLGL